jgi:DNA-3-methyladenine glycosylase I
MADACEWANKDPALRNFHDFEWGHPCVDSVELFEKLCLHSLSVLATKKESIEIVGQDSSDFNFVQLRELYRKAFDNFDPLKLAEFTAERIDRIVAEEKEKEKQEGYKGGFNKNKQRLKSLVNNAKAFNKYEAEGNSFCDFIWSFTGGKVIVGGKKEEELLEIATSLSKGLKDIGFTYTTPPVCLAFMKTAGVINAHESGCSARAECMEEAKIFNKF